MRKSTSIFLLLAAAGLAGCPTSSAHDSGPIPGNDTGPQPDTGVDSGPHVGMDSGPVMGTDVPIASVVNPAAANHPSDGTMIHVTGDLVALTPRFATLSSTSGKCAVSMWVGTLAGGDYSGVQLFESYTPTVAGDCRTAMVIPDAMIGDAITNVVGQFKNFCLSGMSCPANTSQEVDVTHGMVASGANAGTPMATTVSISDVTGAALMVGTRGIALQGALVTITNTIIDVAPVPGNTAPGNNSIMTVHAMGASTPTMAVRVSAYPGVTCQRMNLGHLTPHTGTVGAITGVLQYSFGQWVIVVRQGSDLPNVSSLDCPDAGPAGDAGM